MSARRTPLTDVPEADEDRGSISSTRGSPPLSFKFQITVRGSGSSETEMKISGSTSTSEIRNSNLLPPIFVESDSVSGDERKLVAVSSPSASRSWSRYHSGCAVRGPGYLDWTSTKKAQSSRTGRPHKEHRRYKSTGSRNMKVGKSTGMDEEIIADYLDNNEGFLTDYVVDNVPMDTLERWMIRKIRRERHEGVERKCSLTRWKFCVHADKRKMLQEITLSIQHHQTLEQVFFELGRCISAAVGVDGFRVFRVRLFDNDRIEILGQTEQDKEVQATEVNADDYPIIVDVAHKNEPLRVQHTSGMDLEVGPEERAVGRYLFFQPIVQPDSGTATVLEMWRDRHKFYEEDEEICSSYLVWGGIALHYARLYHEMDRHRTLTTFLLDVVKSIFQNMVSIESLVTKVMNFAQKLVDADRASLFLVDSKTKELYATVFDVGSETENLSESGSEGSTSKSVKKEIRFPLGTGIAGHVAETGEVLNIKDAYEDKRFNRTVDRLTGYKTKTILCMPIYIRSAIIGVVQMVNKRDGYFTKQDEKAFEMFAVYCGLALHHAKLYNKIVRSEQKYKVALEVLSYHNTCTEEEVETALRDVINSTMEDMDDFAFSPFIIDDYHKATHAIYMFIDLFGLNHFDRTELVKFVLTVRKNYRRVPYHNWTHGFSVANSMYNILKKTHMYTRNEKLALFIGCLCHDLDHRGKSNKFMTDTASPLAAIYSTSTMEHHHFNQTITILQQDGHNIFSKLSSSDYKDVLSLVKHCILATDLAAFFPYKTQLEGLVKDQQFQWTKFEHRSLILAVSMTAADLSASAKPWEIQVETVKVIFQEFYQQGDEERAAGREPVPMMDRDRPEEQAASQVGFLTGICLPCYTLLYELMPETKPLLTMCQDNLQRWKRIDQEVAQVIEREKKLGEMNKPLPEHLYIKIEKVQRKSENSSD